jgi:DNA-directed RNA polymerase specialized sigma24 family protein
VETSLLWEAIVRRQKELLIAAKYTMYKRMGRNKVTTLYAPEDLVMEATLKIIRNPNQVKSLGENDIGLVRLFYAAMYHVFIDWSRAEEIRMTYELTDLMHPAVSPTAITDLELQQEMEYLEQALTALGKRHANAEVIIRYALDIGQGETYKTKAEELGVSYTNFKQQVFQGVKVLKKSLHHATT